jgi:hypothetical protein
VITHPSYRVRPRGNIHSSIIVIAHSFGWVPSRVPGQTDPGDPGALRSSSPSAVLSFACELMPSSCQEAQDTFTKAHDSAVQVYGEGDQADRAAFTALKEKFGKRGDHWRRCGKPDRACAALSSPVTQR